MTVRTYRGTEMLVAVVHARNSFGMHSYEGNNILDSVTWSEHIVPCLERESA